jgi:hypothetical protein
VVNEVAQWVAVAALGILVLGVMRQVTMLAPATARSVGGGPSVGDVLPPQLRSGIDAAGAILVFVSEGCAGCMRLMSDLQLAGDVREIGPNHLRIVARAPSSAFESSLIEAGFDYLADRAGEQWRHLNIHSTPLVVHVDSEGKVLWKGVTQDVRRFAHEAA